MRNTNTFITEDYINSIKNEYGHLYEFDYYADGSVDVLDHRGNYITALYTIEDCENFKSKI